MRLLIIFFDSFQNIALLIVFTVIHVFLSVINPYLQD